MKTSIEIKNFPGFYETRFDERYVTEDLRDQLGQDFPDLEYIDDWELPDDYRSKVANKFAEMYVSELNDKLGLKMELLSQQVQSPREYNFATDRIICEIEVADWNSFTNRIVSLMSDIDFVIPLTKIIKENHSSEPGFWSWMSNDIADWYGMIVDPENTNYLECVLWYLYCLKTDESIDGNGDWGMANQIYQDSLSNGDTVTLSPTTDKAQKEYDFYVMLRNQPVLPGFENI